MTTIDKGETVTLEINKSKFITTAFYVASILDIEKILLETKRLYPDCSHICYAYSLENAQKCSDDGEPSGTAGKPILNVIQKNNLTNVLIVCVRYFGGVKLGAGPLTRAYLQSAVLSIKNATLKQLNKMLEISFHISFDKAFKVYLLLNTNLFSLKSRVGNDFVIILEKENKNVVINELLLLDVSDVKIREILV